jgi:Ser/Thr protein kinase RdoA (MazF antagonist)
VSAPVAELVPGFEPESEVEMALARDPALLAGWAWGEPRAGHPEGEVGQHVGDMLARIDERGFATERRRELRFLALVHDSLKNRVHDWLPKRGENHHAMRARRFAARYTHDERLLATLELHDRPYAIWCRMQRTNQSPERALTTMLRKIPDLELFLQFVEVDGSTEGKNPAPVT